MPDISFLVSVYAALEAGEAREAAEHAEIPFVNGYSHAKATQEERLRYVESIRVHPEPKPRVSPEQERMAMKAVGFCIVAAFLAVVIGCVAGKVLRDDIEEVMYWGMMAILGGFVFSLLAAVVCVGFYMAFWA
jgi:hypothetical protein